MADSRLRPYIGDETGDDLIDWSVCWLHMSLVFLNVVEVHEWCECWLISG